MRAGDVLGDRFEIERVAGAGGMGTVYRGLDRSSGRPVALKLLRLETGEGAVRLAREAEVLATLRHPNVVRYVGHGTTPEGQPFLAMEWLEGELLSVRLAREGLTLDEALDVGRAVASGLSAAHALGIVHRDIKPSNVLLVGGLLRRAKLLDFGLARPGMASSITRTGNLLGTPGYMAPEQARGARRLDARADVFALGCLFYKCLTGRAPFEAEDAVAVLARILLDEPRRVRSVRPDIPLEIEELLGRMLAKPIEARPADGAAVLSELERIDLSGADGPRSQGAANELLTGSEKRLVTVVLVHGRDAATGETITDEAWERGKEDVARVEAAAAAFDVKLEVLADHSVVATLGGDPTAGDQAARAARCALAMGTANPDAPMAIVTGMGEMTGAGSVGAVVDRAAAVLRLALGGPPAAPGETLLGLPHRAPIYVDESTASLLDMRYELRGAAPRIELVRERSTPLDVRTLLGFPTPCVGRERELAAILAILEESATEPAARVVLVTAPPGLGKSRLRHELVRRIAREGRFAVWTARGEPLTAGSAFAMLGQGLRSVLGAGEGAPGPSPDAVRARVEASVPAADVERVSEFLGELIGVPSREPSVQLRAARRDARLMGDQMRQAFEDFLAAECERRPVLLVLEDLHWSDVPTVSFVDLALRRLYDRPLAVLALARPEVHASFPRLWEGRPMTSIPLTPLSRKAAERLLVAVLGDGADAAVVDSIVTRAGGNAFFLEELIRAVAEGRGERLPETVLATALSRLESLAAEERRILRAASVFGQTFCDDGVAALVSAGADREGDVRARLDDLARRELVTSRAQGKAKESREYVFRHAIIRDAAYGMLTDHDRVLGHRLAARWLEQAGEADAMVLAGHWQRAGEPARAVGHYLRAAHQALEGHDDAGVVAAVERAIACGAEGEALGEARWLQVEAHRWRGQFEQAERCGLEALGSLSLGHPTRHALLAALIPAAGQLGHAERMMELLEEVRLATGEAGLSARVVAIARGAAQLLAVGRVDAAGPLFEWLDANAPSVAHEDPAAEAAVHFARAMQGLVAGDPSAHLEGSILAVRAFERAGDARNVCIQLTNVGYAHIELGAYADAEHVLRSAMERSVRMGLDTAAADAAQNLGYALAMLGQTAEAISVEEASIECFVVQKLPRMEAGGRGCLALILARAGDFVRAEEQALRAVEVAADLPPTRAFALAALARARLGRGDTAGALEASRAAMQILSGLRGIEFGEALIRLASAEALEAAGDRAAAASAIAAARLRLLQRAASISSEARRESFLRNVPENARTLDLAARWCGAA